ncbi:MAG: 30S ribosomal protein S8 [Candidatus Omnitrophica bacterium]|nr:30S ribosomal protein S8 [Candidatus Omnitrophota bacterium]
MSVTDFIADQLTVIRNGIMSGKKTVILKRSGMLVGILDIIKKEGFIEDYQVIADKMQGKIKVYLKFLEDGTSVLEGLVKSSTPGRRNYVVKKKVTNVMGGSGIAIISTSKGLMTDKEAVAQGIGGEMICKVW